MLGRSRFVAHVLRLAPGIAAVGCALSAAPPEGRAAGGMAGLGATAGGSEAATSGRGGAGGKGGRAGAAGSSARGGTSGNGDGEAGDVGVGTGGTDSGATGGTGTGGTGAAGGGEPGSGGLPGSGGASAGSRAGGASGSGGRGAMESGENSGADCAVSAGPLRQNPKLPDPFAMNDGARIGTKAEWACRRNEIKKDIEKFEIGPKPEPPTVEASLSGTTLNVQVTTTSGTLTLTSNITSAPGSGPHCVAIGMNGNSPLVSGCTHVPFMHDQVVTYTQESTQDQNDPFYAVHPELWGKIGNYAAWSWGISRLVDGLEQVKDQLNLDLTKVGVHGCSYAGKMALFAGAFDERVALTVAQESGGGGVNSWRLSQDFTTRTGTAVEKIDNTNYGWFLPSMQALDPYGLPHDHHELIAMIAPRALLVLGNTDFDFLGDESGYKSVMVAKEVWRALGVEERVGFDFSGGHGHCMAAPSQANGVTLFVNRFLKGQSESGAVTVKPSKSGFDYEYQNSVDWFIPALQ